MFKPPPLVVVMTLDPMMGGGTTLHEAIRLGANVIGADLDPIPVLQARATMSNVPLRQLDFAFEELLKTARQKLGKYYKTDAPCCKKSTEFQYVLHGQQKRCKCGDVLVVDSYDLRYESDGSVVRIDPRTGNIYRSQSVELSDEFFNDPNGSKINIIEKSVQRCSICSQLYSEHVEKPFYKRFEPIAIVGNCNCESSKTHKIFFKKPDLHDLQKIADADKRRPRYARYLKNFTVKNGPKSNDLLAHKISSYLELFSSRQLLYITEMIRLIKPHNYLIKLNLGLLVSTSLEFNSMLCSYKGGNKSRPGAIRHVFSHHAYSFPHTALENNPLFKQKTSGTLTNLYYSRIQKARVWASAPSERLIEDGKVVDLKAIVGEQDFGFEVKNQSELRQGIRRFMLLQGTSANLALESNSIDYIVTDPPYFDNVQYSDLSNFFRVWLRYLFPNEATWVYDINDSAVDPKTNGNGQYEAVLRNIFQECYRVLCKQGGRLIFTFHHWNPKGWAALTSALKQAQFILVNWYVIHAENPASVHIANIKSLKHDAILVLAPCHEAIDRNHYLCRNRSEARSGEYQV